MTNQRASRAREEGRHWLPSQGVDPAPLAELNAECLGLLASRAAEAAARQPVPPLLLALRDQWADLPAAAVRRLAAAPFSLFDMLVYAWHLARSRPRAACLVFGTSVPAAESLAACSLSALEAVAECNADALKPRWSLQIVFWRELLTAASAGTDARLRELLLGGIQRLAAETLGAHPP
jgi:hypothetical protein